MTLANDKPSVTGTPHAHLIRVVARWN